MLERLPDKHSSTSGCPDTPELLPGKQDFLGLNPFLRFYAETCSFTPLKLRHRFTFLIPSPLPLFLGHMTLCGLLEPVRGWRRTGVRTPGGRAVFSPVGPLVTSPAPIFSRNLWLMYRLLPSFSMGVL